MSVLEETIKETITAHDQMLKRLWCIAYEEGQKAEREACAELFESAHNQEWSSELVAYQIRNMRRSHQSKG